MRKTAITLCVAGMSLGLAACGSMVNPQLYGNGAWNGRGINNPGLAAAGPAGAAAARLGMGGNSLVLPGGAGQSIYGNTMYDPATHPMIQMQNQVQSMRMNNGTGVVVTTPVGTMNQDIVTATPAASPRDVGALRDSVRILMRHQVEQGRRIGRLEQR